MGEFKWFFFAFIILFVIWIVGGGPDRASSRDPFIHQPNPIGEGGTYSRDIFPNLNFFPSFVNPSPRESAEDTVNRVGSEAEEIRDALQESESNNASIYKGIATLNRPWYSQNNPDNEYLTIQISTKIQSSINIYGWRLRSSITGNSVELGGATYLPRLGGQNKKFPIAVEPGGKIIVTTGRSPIGVSFRLNRCTGYLEQFQNFSPYLPKKCPRAEDEIPSEYRYGTGPNSFNSECMDFIEQIPLCRINTKDIPLNMQPQCQIFVTRDINYNSCIDKHKNEDGFYINEWRLFLERDYELWRDKREVIELIDAEGKLIDVITY